MAHINLLPWREKQREQETKLFIAMLLSGIVVALFLVFILYSYSLHLIDNQTERNNMLQKEITILDEQTKEIKSLKQVKAALISRMSVIQNLQSIRTLMVHFFDELIKIMPPGVYVYQLERKNDVVTLSGYSESNTNISILMRNIESNAWIQTPVLMEIKKMDGNTQPANNDFKLNFILKPHY